MKTILFCLLLTSAYANAQTTHMINWFMGVTSGQASRTINVGDTVTWTWTEAGMPHTVTSLGTAHESFDSGLLIGIGQTFSHTFTTAGSSPYVCSFHPSMQGTITVSSLAVPNFGSGKLVAWPNPVSDVLTLSGVEGKTRIRIFDATGKSTMDSTVDTPNVRIYMEHFPDGLYEVETVSDGGTKKFKIIKI
ncbi:MAG TPA: T9SS type A sorting domain-containing protein [Flavobacterium sp.]|nr:T9SS type A sorting domain-containing protein [Flavobacterium sp.]